MPLAISINESKAKEISIPSAAITESQKTRVEFIPKAEADLSAARAQLSAIKEYQSSMLDTVHWALGVVVTITALLAGFGWWANFKMFADDKTRLKEELNAIIRDSLAEFETRANGHERELLQRVEDRLGSTSTRLDKGLDYFRRELAKSADVGDRRAQDTLANFERVTSIFDMLAKRVNEVEALVRQVEENIWDLKDLPGNILLTQAQSLEAAIAADSGELARSALNRMKETILTRIQPGKHSLPKSTLDLLAENLIKAAKVDPVLSAEVQALVFKIKEASGKSDA